MGGVGGVGDLIEGTKTNGTYFSSNNLFNLPFLLH